jgi:hypothetical protein
LFAPPPRPPKTNLNLPQEKYVQSFKQIVGNQKPEIPKNSISLQQNNHQDDQIKI